MALPIVLVLDDDLGFAFALSQELINRKMVALPARAPTEARSLLMRLQLEPDVLVINCGSQGACNLADELARQNPNVRIIGIVSDGNACSDCADLLAALFDEQDDKAPERIPYCADVIQALVREQRRTTHRAGES
jgi:hypothetical protein